MNRLVALEHRTTGITVASKELAITDNNTFSQAAELLKTIKALQLEVGSNFDPVVDSAYKAHRAALDARRKHLDPLANAETIIKNKISLYQREIKRKREEEQRRIFEEKERLRLREAAKKREEERLLNEAIEAEQQGRVQQADKILETASQIADTPPPVVKQVVITPAAPKVAGVVTRKVWNWRLEDIEKVPREYLILDSKLISAVVKAKKDTASIPGIHVYVEDQISASGKGQQC